MTIATRLTAMAAFFLIAQPAYAHMGHVGEIAGHSHWIGVAAAGAAAAIAIGLSAIGRKKDAVGKAEKPDAPESAAEGDETPAGA